MFLSETAWRSIRCCGAEICGDLLLGRWRRVRPPPLFRAQHVLGRHDSGAQGVSALFERLQPDFGSLTINSPNYGDEETSAHGRPGSAEHANAFCRKKSTTIKITAIPQTAAIRLAGLIFNYRDGGNFYCFSFNDDFVKFMRYVDHEVVGDVMQGIRWKGQRRTDMEWVLTYDGSTLRFSIDGDPMLTIRYMPLDYAGVGFYAFGNQELVIDEVEFIQ